MSRLVLKNKNKQLRQRRVRSVVVGTAERPRLSAHVSNKHVSAQLIDDANQLTLVAVTSASQKAISGTLTEKSAWVGETLAKKAAAKKIKLAVFDRGSKLYHGRIKALAEAARAGGLEF